jgi:hypothetical protein
MTNENPVRFTLNDNTTVIVKKVTNNKYDFEMILPNGNRRTFVWANDKPFDLGGQKGYLDALAIEAVNRFFNR